MVPQRHDRSWLLFPSSSLGTRLESKLRLRPVELERSRSTYFRHGGTLRCSPPIHRWGQNSSTDSRPGGTFDYTGLRNGTNERLDSSTGSKYSQIRHTMNHVAMMTKPDKSGWFREPAAAGFAR